MKRAVLTTAAMVFAMTTVSPVLAQDADLKAAVKADYDANLATLFD